MDVNASSSVSRRASRRDLLRLSRACQFAPVVRTLVLIEHMCELAIRMWVSGDVASEFPLRPLRCVCVFFHVRRSALAG